jgi:hypothetical protein
MITHLKPSLRRLVLGSAAAIGISSCAIFASHEEVTAWRAIRENTNSEERLVALAEYAARYPGGAFIAEANTELSAQETTIWETGNSSREGLEYYLRTYPSGVYVSQARERLDALTTVGERREVEEARVEEMEAARAADAATDRRLWAGRAMEFWTRNLIGIRNFGSPLGAVARANPDFSRVFGEAPAPVCTATSCLKHYHGHFAIPNPGGTRIERDMHMYLRLSLGDRGRLERAEVLLPNKGFSRWYELENRVLVTDEDPEQRQAAIEWVLARLEPIIAEVASGSRPIDFLPDPIPPITASEAAASTTAADAADETPSSPAVAPAAEASAPVEAPAGGGTSAIDELLAAAAGSDESGAAGDTAVAVDDAASAGAAEATVVFPNVLRAIQRGNVRIVVFAAGDEDYGDAYDGFFVERVRE